MGDVVVPPAWSKAGDVCISSQCLGKQHRRGLCMSCYRRWRHQTPKENRPWPTVAERFTAKVDRRGPDECWPWLGHCRLKEGHGQFYVSRERGTVAAHTFAVEFSTGERCPPGKEGCHRCDNPPCCNPSHVYYGTRQQNVDDCTSRGRQARGQTNGQARLSERDVLEIRVRAFEGARAVQLGREFGVSSTLIRLIVRGKRWAHIGGPIQKTLRKTGRCPEKEVA